MNELEKGVLGLQMFAFSVWGGGWVVIIHQGREDGHWSQVGDVTEMLLSWGMLSLADG